MPPTHDDLTETASELRIVLTQLLRRLREENAIPLSHAAVLARLEREGPRHTSALAAAERIRPQSMAQTIGDLEADGLISRRPDPLDGRQILIELTSAGERALEQERTRRDGWLATAISSALDEREQQALIDAVALLRRLTLSPTPLDHSLGRT